MTAVSRLPLHPVVFAAYAVLFLYASNLSEVLLVDAVAPLARAVLGASLLWAALTLLFRDARRGAVVASGVVIAFFGYGHVSGLLGDLRLSYLVQLAGWLVLVIGAIVYAVRAKTSIGRTTGALNAVAMILVVLAATTIVPYEIGRAARMPVVRAGANAPTELVDAPDIYYLVFDRYGSADAIERRFGITDNELYGWLADRGFQLPADSRANYRATDFSLAATLNMRYLDQLTTDIGRDSGDRTPARQLIEQHEVGRFLKAQGYRYYHLGSWFEATITNPLADTNLSLGTVSEFENVLRDTTMLPALERLLGIEQSELTFRDRHREGALFTFRQLRRLATAPGPKFVLAHVLLPHDPYVFRADGSTIPEAESQASEEADLYAGQLEFVNGQIKALVEQLLSGPDASDPIVILQADEGPLLCRSTDCPTDTPEYYAIRFGILNAMYLPGVDRPLPATFSSVNTFRVVLREYFGADLDPLPDRSFTWPDNDHIYDFRDVTEQLDSTR